MSQIDPELQSTPAAAEELSVPAWVYPYRAGIIGGFLGGVAMIAVAVIYGLSSGRGVWLPVNLIGATMVQELQIAPLEQLSAFNPIALIIGLTLHMALSIGLGFIFALVLPTFPGSPLLWAIIIGPLLWALASVLILPLLNPVMAQNVDHLSFFVAHVVYSIVLGLWIARTPKVRA
jgi:hypothetical protein